MDEGDENEDATVTGEIFYCGTVVGPPAGSDSPGVPVLEWLVRDLYYETR